MNRIDGRAKKLAIILLGCLLILAGIIGVFPSAQVVPENDNVLAGSNNANNNQPLAILLTKTPFLPVYPTALSIPVTSQPDTQATQSPDALVSITETQMEPAVPTSLIIPSIELDAPVVPVIYYLTEIDGVTYKQYQSLNYFAAGWHSDSARAGEIGNTVINGHNNAYGEVFAELADVQVGDSIDLESENGTFHYTVVNRIIFPDSYYMEFDKRVSNGRWVARSSDNRLTLVTCWPYETYTHRLVLVAMQVGVN